MKITMIITDQEVLRLIQLKKACLIADIRDKEIGYFGHITLQHIRLEVDISRGRQRNVWTRKIIKL